MKQQIELIKLDNLIKEFDTFLATFTTISMNFYNGKIKMNDYMTLLAGLYITYLDKVLEILEYQEV